MSGLHRRMTVGLATSTGLLGLTFTSGLAILANRFVEEFSRPHLLIDDSSFTWAIPAAPYEPPSSCQQTILFQAADGTLLCGDFWTQPQPAPTVILCHGYRASRAHLRSVAALQHACGYNVLFFDFRGHGESDSVMTSAGNAEVCDLEAAIEVASRQPETLPGKIILYGFSMGAAVALLTPPHADVVAIIADSPYARSDEVLHRLVCYQLRQNKRGWEPLLRLLSLLAPPIAWAIVMMCEIVFRVRFGYTFVARPSTSFRRWKARAKAVLQQHTIPILLIHSSADELIPFAHALRIAAEAKTCNVALETYFVDHALHCGAYQADPDSYNKVIQHFLAQSLGDDLPPQHMHFG